MNNLICPNCRKDLFLSEKEKEINGTFYDLWCCYECTHITVLDWRRD